MAKKSRGEINQIHNRLNLTPKISTNKYCLSLIAAICCLFFAFYYSPAPARAQSVSNNLALTWSTNTFTSPSYEGKPLPVYGSVIAAVVSPLNAAAGNIEELNYTWSLNGDKQIYDSGKDKTEFMFRVNSSAGSYIFITVRIQDDDNNTLAELVSAVPVVSPEVILSSANGGDNYSDSQISESAWLLSDQEMQLVATPYFFNIVRARELEYQWLFEGQPVIKVEDVDRFSLKIEKGILNDTMQKELSVYVVNPKNRAQSANDKINIIVGKG
ncbi:MAG: hypothetical protein HY813_00465 [Candidatus Portnoybacteria bacterium]|nr:hypothetical protein [Candidatus Portnoybacteria bacterium]